MVKWSDDKIASRLSELDEICIKDKFWNNSDNHKQFMRLKKEQEIRKEEAKWKMFPNYETSKEREERRTEALNK